MEGPLATAVAPVAAPHAARAAYATDANSCRPAPRRAFQRPPVLAVLGHGRAGKDTACEWLRDNTTLRFAGGTSWVARHHMAERLSADLGRPVTPDEAFARRHEDRDKWFRYLNDFTAHEPLRLLRMVLADSDLACGLRRGSEVILGQQEGLIDLSIWVENPRVPPDPTVAFRKEDCDVIILNEADLDTFYRRLKRLAAALGILRN